MPEKTPLEISQGVNEILKKRIGNYRNLVESLMEERLQAAAERAGTVKPKAMGDLVARGKATFTVLEDGSAIEARNPADGQLLFGPGSLKPITIDEWAESLKTITPFYWQVEKKDKAGGQNLEDQLEAAIKAKDLQRQIRLKRLISEARQAV